MATEDRDFIQLKMWEAFTGAHDDFQKCRGEALTLYKNANDAIARDASFPKQMRDMTAEQISLTRFAEPNFLVLSPTPRDAIAAVGQWCGERLGASHERVALRAKESGTEVTWNRLDVTGNTGRNFRNPDFRIMGVSAQTYRTGNVRGESMPWVDETVNHRWAFADMAPAFREVINEQQQALGLEPIRETEELANGELRYPRLNGAYRLTVTAPREQRQTMERVEYSGMREPRVQMLDSVPPIGDEQAVEFARERGDTLLMTNLGFVGSHPGGHSVYEVLQNPKGQFTPDETALAMTEAKGNVLAHFAGHAPGNPINLRLGLLKDMCDRAIGAPTDYQRETGRASRGRTRAEGVEGSGGMPIVPQGKERGQMTGGRFTAVLGIADDRLASVVFRRAEAAQARASGAEIGG